MAVVDELVTLLGVQLGATALSNLARFKGGLDGVRTGVRALATGVVTGTAGIGYLVNRIAGQANDLDILAQKTGVSTDALQRWRFAATAAGVSAASVEQDVLKLQRRFMGWGGAEKFLDRLSGRFQNVAPRQAAWLGSMFGISADTALLLTKGPEEAIKRGAEFKRSLDELLFGLKGLNAQIALALIPVLSLAVAKIKAWIAANKALILTNIQGFMQGLLNACERLIRILDNILKRFAGIRTYFKGLKADLTEVEFWTSILTAALMGIGVALAPLLLKVTLLLGLLISAGAIVDDLVRFAEGKSSVAQRVADYLLEKLEAIKKALREIATLVADTISDMVMLIPGTGQAKTVGDYLNKELGIGSSSVTGRTLGAKFAQSSVCVPAKGK
jgi:hypothetical protein